MYKTSFLTLALAFVVLSAPFFVGAASPVGSTQSLTTHIQALQADVSALMSASSMSNSNRAVGVPARPCFAFMRALSVGARGSDVSALQQFLLDQGHSIPAGATGYFGAQTKAAVKEWQATNNVALSTDSGSGIFGPRSRGAFSRWCGMGGTATSTPSTISFSADPQSGIPPLLVTFTASAPITDSSSTFSVDFGDMSTAGTMTQGSCIAITAIVGGQGGIRCSATVAHSYTAVGTYTAKLMRDTCPKGAQCFVGPQVVGTTIITVSASTSTTTSNSVRLNAPGTVTLALGDNAEVRNKSSFFTLTELTATSATIQVMPVGCWNSFPSDPVPEIRCMIAIMPVPPVTLTVGQSYEAPSYRITLSSIVNGKATFALATTATN